MAANMDITIRMAAETDAEEILEIYTPMLLLSKNAPHTAGRLKPAYISGGITGEPVWGKSFI